MTTTQSTRRKRPAKPRRDFPLYAHANGQWCKQVNGKKYYFGTWADPVAAEALWDHQKEDIRAGREPKDAAIIEGRYTVRRLCNEFLTSKELQVKTGERSQRQFDDLHRACKLAVRIFGANRSIDNLGPNDFRKVKTRLSETYKAPASLKREMANFRSIFNYAMRNALTERIIRFGDDFRAPSVTVIRKYKNEQRRTTGKRKFEPRECRRLIANATPALKAMILLGLNCGLGNTDLRKLQFCDVDLDRGWLDYPRSKTGTDRVAKLWPETIKAIKNYLKDRPEAKDPSDDALVFITRHGKPFGSGRPGSDPIGDLFYKLTKKLGFYRPGLTFYALRHSFRTAADGAKDEPAVNLVMGHVDPTMGANYRQEIEPVRLFAVAKHVRLKLFKSGRKLR